MISVNLHHISILVLIVTILQRVDSVCELSFRNKNKQYYFNLPKPIYSFPHGILSEDGFYKAVANETVLWFQLCDQMIFNQKTPACVDCKDCRGSSRCGVGCSALVSQNIGGYPVCSAIRHPSSTVIEPIDVDNPKIGIVVLMSSSPPAAQNCSVKVSVICDYKRFDGPQTVQKTGECDYVTQLKHPSGCAYISSVGGNGWGWFGTLIMLSLLIFGAYMLSGALYRHFHLGIHGIDVIPHLEVWVTLPSRVQSYYNSVVRRFRGPSEGYRSSYSPVNF